MSCIVHFVFYERLLNSYFYAYNFNLRLSDSLLEVSSKVNQLINVSIQHLPYDSLIKIIKYFFYFLITLHYPTVLLDESTASECNSLLHLLPTPYPSCSGIQIVLSITLHYSTRKPYNTELIMEKELESPGWVPSDWTILIRR